MEDYDKLWKTLEALVIEIKRRGGIVPEKVFDDLKYAKTMISIFRRDSSSLETMANIESLLGNVEINLISLAEIDYGKEYADEWLMKIREARNINSGQKTVPPSRFIPGIPAGEHWVRLKPADDNERREIEDLAHNVGLSFDWRNNNYLIIHGDKGKIKTLVRRIAEKTKQKE